MKSVIDLYDVVTLHLERVELIAQYVADDLFQDDDSTRAVVLETIKPEMAKALEALEQLRCVVLDVPPLPETVA